MHETPNPHDAEEQLRPYLGEVHEAMQDASDLRQRLTPIERAQRAALDKALDLLGVQR